VKAVLLIDHGSRRDAANQIVVAVAATVRETHGGIVEHAHMELAPPSIADGVTACVEAGATELVAVPYFLGPGRHVTEDVPRLVADACRAHGLPFTIAEPFGADPLIAELVARRAGL